jgi:hypothetical protein
VCDKNLYETVSHTSSQNCQNLNWEHPKQSILLTPGSVHQTRPDSVRDIRNIKNKKQICLATSSEELLYLKQAQHIWIGL